MLREQHAAIASTELLFTAWYSGVYDDYMIDIIGLIPDTATANVSMQFSITGGNSYDSANNYATSLLESSSGGSGTSGASTTNPIIVMRNLATTAGYSSSGSYKLYAPGGASYKKIVGVGQVTTSTSAESQTLAANYRSTSIVDAFRIFMSAGSITSGIVRVYGIVKA